MKHRIRPIQMVVGVAYLVAALISYFWEIDAVLFFLSLPWSGVVAMLSPLLGHMFGIALDVWLLIGSLLNFILFTRLFIIEKRIDNIS